MNLRATALAALLGAALPIAASAAEAPIDGLAWKWNDKAVRYQIYGTLFVPDWIWLRALNNLEIRVNEVYVEMVTTCSPRTPGKKRWEVRCTIDAIGIQAAALPADSRRSEKATGNLDKILEEWTERLTGTAINTQWSETGRVRSVTLPDLNRMNRRDGENIEIIRQLMVRMLSPLEIGLPKKGTDRGERFWTEKEPLIAGFLSDSGTVGSVPTEHVIDAQRGSQVRIRSQGKGTVSNASQTQSVGGGEQLRNFFEVEFTTETFFDVDAGHMVRREAIFGGTPTASSQLADGFQGLPYLQTYRVQLVAADAPPPIVMPSREVEPELFKSAQAAKDKASGAPETLPTLPVAPPAAETLPAVPPSVETLPALPKADGGTP
jgi:hypothetical protein